MKLLIYILFLITLTLQSCIDDEFPSITASGKHTLGCKINGKKWWANDRSAFGSTSGVNLFWVDAGVQRLNIYGHRNLKDKDESISISIDNTSAIREQTYLLTPENSRVEIKKRDEKNNTSCYVDELYTGSITISKIDRENGFIAGTFEFVLAPKDCSEELVITEGRFDLKR